MSDLPPADPSCGPTCTGSPGEGAGGPPGDSRGEPTRGPAGQAPGGPQADGCVRPSCGAVGDASGEVVADRYHLLEILGEGGMGVVFRAWDSQLDRQVALKRLRANSSPDAIRSERFTREARLAARLHHPHIVGVHDFGVDGGGAFLAMEFVPGRTFGAYLQEFQAACAADPRRASGRMREAVGLLAGAAHGVAHAHAEGMIHRDLKPANILLDRNGTPRVTDFGLAREIDAGLGEDDDRAARLTRAGEAIGTPAYMSPEQAEGDAGRLGPPADVWALGVMLYEILAGRRPFSGDSAFAILSAVIGKDPDPPGRSAARVPRDLSAVAMKALEKDPGRRYRHAGQFVAELERWLAGEPLETRPPGRVRRARIALRRRKALLPALLALLLFLAVAAVAVGSRIASRLSVLHQFEEIGRLFAGYEDRVLRTEMLPEDRHVLARQPLDLLVALMQEDPTFGPAWAWRGRLHSLDGRYREAEEDFGRACALAPEEAYVWFLRGIHFLERHARARLRGDLIVGDSGAAESSVAPETPEERGWRERAIADLERSAVAADSLVPLRPEDAVLAQVLVALLSGGAAGGEEAVRRLAGADGPRVCMIRGMALRQLGRFDEAAAAFERTLADWPAYGPAWANRADARWVGALGKAARGIDPRESYRAALEDFAQALRLDLDFPAVHLNRAGLLWAISEAQAARGEDPRETLRQAMADVDEALRLGARAEDARVNRGIFGLLLARALRDAGADPAAALDCARTDLDAALAVDPRDFRGLIQRASLRIEEANVRLARGEDARPAARLGLADVDAAIAIDPFQRGVQDARSVVLICLGHAEAARGADPRASWEGAVAAAEAEMARHPGSPGSLLNRGAAHGRLAQEQLDRGEDPRARCRLAETDLSAALDLDPTLAAARIERARARLRLGLAEAQRGSDPQTRFRQAAEDCALALEQNPGHVEAHLVRAEAFVDLGKCEVQAGGDPRESFRTAVEAATRALARRPGDPRAHSQRGTARHWLGMAEAERGQDAREIYRQAAADHEETVRLDPTSGAAWNGLGLALGSLARGDPASGGEAGKRYAQAEAAFRTATERGQPAAWMNLGILLRSRGRFDEAIVAFERLAEALPAAAGSARTLIEETRKLRQK